MLIVTILFFALFFFYITYRILNRRRHAPIFLHPPIIEERALPSRFSGKTFRRIKKVRNFFAYGWVNNH